MLEACLGKNTTYTKRRTSVSLTRAHICNREEWGAKSHKLQHLPAGIGSVLPPPAIGSARRPPGIDCIFGFVALIRCIDLLHWFVALVAYLGCTLGLFALVSYFGCIFRLHVWLILLFVCIFYIFS